MSGLWLIPFQQLWLAGRALRITLEDKLRGECRVADHTIPEDRVLGEE